MEKSTRVSQLKINQGRSSLSQVKTFRVHSHWHFFCLGYSCALTGIKGSSKDYVKNSLFSVRKLCWELLCLSFLRKLVTFSLSMSSGYGNGGLCNFRHSIFAKIRFFVNISFIFIVALGY